CQYRTNSNRDHLLLRNIQEFDISYLEALLSNDKVRIKHYEQRAYEKGYGPLVPCTFQASPSEQKQCCPHWHRADNGELRQGILHTTSKCPVRFSIYTPNDLDTCPFIVIISRNLHNHARPLAVKTPPAIKDVFHSMLVDLDWKLADTTPRKLVVDAGFTKSLRQYLNWELVVDPSISELHPSLGNFDHVRRLINDIRKSRFPEGTGFSGTHKLLVEQHRLLPECVRYVQCAEVYSIEGGKSFYLIICMSKDMALHLLTTKHLSIDTSFKHVHGKWQEFEMESWIEDRKRCNGCWCSAFTTSQSSLAHLILFQRIFSIATEVTRLPVEFSHIHGSGYLTWIADAHKGQALGVGLYCQSLCTELNQNCPIKPEKMLSELSPYDHLKHFYRLCNVHFKRNVNELRGKGVSSSAIEAMFSLATTVPQDLKHLYAVIEAGGPKACAWLKDKIDAKFVIPAIHHAESLIPLNVWQSSPSSTNGNEQAHRDVNRDGINLTVLGGVMRGMHRDFRAMKSLVFLRQHQQWF
ncbi:hypothetical protein BDQ17DRAFT_1249116, partial [Cyathus striatus]